VAGRGEKGRVSKGGWKARGRRREGRVENMCLHKSSLNMGLFWGYPKPC